MARCAQATPGWPASASPGSAMSEDSVSPGGRPPGAPREAGLGGRPPEATDASVPVVIRLVRAIDRNTDVRGLLLGERGQPDAERVQVQPRDPLVEMLGQHVNTQ